MHFQTIVRNYGQLSLFIWENSCNFAHRSNETMFNYLVQTAMKTNELQGSEALLLVRKQLASCYSTAAQVMYEFDLKKVVQIYLPSCSDAQFHALMHLIEDDVICILPLPRGSRMLVYCDVLTDFNDEQNMLLYQLHLESVFANKQGRMTQPYGVRIYEFANYEEEC